MKEENLGGVNGEEDPREQADGMGGSAVPIFIWIGIALVLYVLGVGPAVKIHSRASPAVQHFIEIFYSPLEHIAHTPLGRPLNWWVDLWRK